MQFNKVINRPREISEVQKVNRMTHTYAYTTRIHKFTDCNCIHISMENRELADPNIFPPEIEGAIATWIRPSHENIELILRCNIYQPTAPIFFSSPDALLITWCAHHINKYDINRAPSPPIYKISLWSTWKYGKRGKLDAHDRKIERSARGMRDARHTGCCWSESKVSMGIRVWPLDERIFKERTVGICTRICT